MLIKTITDETNGKKWEIFKKSDNEYFYKYYEFFKQIGWRLTGRISECFTKECIEWELDITIN